MTSLAESEPSGAANANPQDLADLLHAAENVLPTFRKAEKAVQPVHWALGKLKDVGFGLPWKAAVKMVPTLQSIEQNIERLHASLDGLVTPTRTLCDLLPQVTEGLQGRESGTRRATGLSGQLLVTTRVSAGLSGELRKLNDLTRSTCSAVRTCSSSTERLHGVAGVGRLADKPNESLLNFETYLLEVEARNQELLATSERTVRWLPSYQAHVRERVTSAKACQATVKVSFFKKESGRRQVTWYDDEAEAVCGYCRISICEEHRVEAPAEPDAAVRCTWLCLQHRMR